MGLRCIRKIYENGDGMKPIGAAVVGTGFIGPVHVEAIRRLGHHVVGILGSTPEKSRAAAASLGLEIGFPSYADLLADPRVEIVHLASPNPLHFEQCRQALAIGKHILCEKPLAISAQQTAELVRLADRSSLITAVNYNIRFYPLVLEARERVLFGSMGDLFHVTGSYLQDWLLEATDYNWRVEAETGGPLRAVADIGTHWLDAIRFITGREVEAVCADLQTVHATRQRPVGGAETFSRGSHPRATEPVPIMTEDYGSILLRFTGGSRGVVTVSQVTAGRKNALRFDIACSKGSLSWDSEEPNTMVVGSRHGANAALIRDPSLLGTSARGHADYPGGHAEGFPDTFKQLVKAVYADVAMGHRSPEPLYATFTDGHREALVCEAILQSHHEQRWVTVAS